MMKKITLFAVLLCLSLGRGVSQERPPHEIQSMMIYNFLKYIQWPASASSGGEFVIGVIGDDNIYKTLSTWYGNKVRSGQKFVIKKYASVDEISDCQLLYVGKSAAGQFGSIKSKLSKKSTLTVSSKNGLGKAGSCINFRVVNNRLKFELNQAAVKQADLKIAGQLNAMAILI